MKSILPISVLSFLFISPLLFSQHSTTHAPKLPHGDTEHNTTGHVCSRQSPYTPPSFPQPAAKSVLTNPRVYVQSIHNVVAKWDNGSVYRFDIGTTPGGDDIYNGHLLWNTDKYTPGHSYEELKNYALAQGTTFNIGDIFYLNLYDTGNNLDTAFECQFVWEDLGDAANAITIIIETNYGANGAAPFAQWQANKMMDFYNLANPILLDIFGPPSRNHEVTIVNDSYAVGTNTYYNGPNQVSSSYATNADGDLDQPRLMIHELVHAYRDNVVLSSNAEWHYDPYLSGFEEGMAEAVAIIVMDKFAELYPNFWNGDEFKIHWNSARGMPFEWDYDFQNHSQLTTEDFFSSDIATGSHWVRYGVGAAAMKKMYIEDNNFFKNFNAAYYAALNNDHTLIPSRNLMVNLISSVKPQIERTPAATWIDNQHILDCSITPGEKVFMLSFTSLSWASFQHDNRIFCLETHQNGLEWKWNSSDQAGANEVPDGDPNANWAWTHQFNNISGNIGFIRDWNNTTSSNKAMYANNHWVTDNGGPYAGQTLLGPSQGANPYYVGANFTRDHEQDNCSLVPGCGKRAWAMGSQDIYTTTSNAGNMWPMMVSQGGTVPDQRVSLNMNESGLYRFQIDFNSPNGGLVSDSYYRLLGDNFISWNDKGLIGGIYTPTGTQVDGRMFIEHEDHGEELELTLSNNSFKGDRTWTSNLEPLVQFQGGRTDRRYSDPGEVHAIYLNPDCSEKKIDFRTLGYGDGLDGTEMLLFNKDEFEDIIFTEALDMTVMQGSDFLLTVTNNFPDILNDDSRITYSWSDPAGNAISTDTNHLFTNAQFSDDGIYTVSVDFFGCPIFDLPVVVSVTDVLPVDIVSLEAELLRNETVSVDWHISSEQNAKNYTVEKSTDGVNWEFLTTVEAAGNTSSQINYNAIDENPSYGMNYYHLTLTNLNGVVDDLGIATAMYTPNLSIYPNPVQDQLFVTGKGIEDATVTAHSILGQPMHLAPQSIEYSTLSIPTDHLAPGVYFLTFDFGTYTTSSRIVIK